MANALQDAAIAGFAPSGPGATLLAAFVEPYFAEVGRVWARRSIEVAQKVAVGLYPRWAIDQRDRRRRRAAWASAEHPPSLRRLVSEGTSSVERALAARQRTPR